MISHQHKCIFIHIPKCAGTSIESALGHLDGHTGGGGQDHRSIRMIEKPLLTKHLFASRKNLAEAYRGIRNHYFRSATNPRNKVSVTNEQYNAYFKFTIVRNPWSRAFSWYKRMTLNNDTWRKLRIKGKPSLDKALRKYAGGGLLRTQVYWLRNYEGQLPLDFIGRFENLPAAFQEIKDTLNISGVLLPHKLEGSGEDYREAYDESSNQIIKEVYKEDIETFGYAFDL